VPARLYILLLFSWELSVDALYSFPFVEKGCPQQLNHGMPLAHGECPLKQLIRTFYLTTEDALSFPLSAKTIVDDTLQVHSYSATMLDEAPPLAPPSPSL
jgi:hypothetical protein